MVRCSSSARWVAAALLAVCLLADAPAAVAGTFQGSTVTSRALQARGPLQNPELTPGAADPAVTQANVATTICVVGYTSTVRNVSSALRRKVFAEYHIGLAARKRFVIDHLVALEIGGSNDISNLWPELKRGEFSSKRKDRVENALHDEVCAGDLTLVDAQHSMATDWVKAETVAANAKAVTTKKAADIAAYLAAIKKAQEEQAAFRAYLQAVAQAQRAPPQNCPNGTYTNVDGNQVCSPYTPSNGGVPAGATARCNDGTYSFSQHHQGTCSSHGGVAQFL